MCCNLSFKWYVLQLQLTDTLADTFADTLTETRLYRCAAGLRYATYVCKPHLTSAVLISICPRWGTPNSRTRRKLHICTCTFICICIVIRTCIRISILIRKYSYMCTCMYVCWRFSRQPWPLHWRFSRQPWPLHCWTSTVMTRLISKCSTVI
jgi:hypothetical protein